MRETHYHASRFAKTTFGLGFHQGNQSNFKSASKGRVNIYREIIANQIQQVLAWEVQVEKIFSKPKSTKEGLELAGRMLIRKYFGDQVKLLEWSKAILNGDMPVKWKSWSGGFGTSGMQFIAKSKRESRQKKMQPSVKNRSEEKPRCGQTKAQKDSKTPYFAEQYLNGNQIVAGNGGLIPSTWLGIRPLRGYRCAWGIISEIKSQLASKSCPSTSGTFSGKTWLRYIENGLAGNKLDWKSERLIEIA